MVVGGLVHNAHIEERPTFAGVDDYVKRQCGSRPIKKVLIANNGISAVKAIRSIRRWAYETFGNEREVQFVVMATPEDMRANAEYIRMADEVAEVPGGSNNNNYANVMLIVELAERWGVDAVWAGWGHASENPVLPDTLAETASKIVFIGPTGKPMRALGDKIASTIIAQSAKVPTIAWNGDGVTVDYRREGLTDEVFRRGQVFTAAECTAACNRIGLPVMIKASEGGGGKGIRKVTAVEDIEAAFRAVQAEIPGSPIFVMKLASRSRHLEVQLLADQYGHAIALSGRDCSIQRRHQKIIEEGPVLAASPETWREMEMAAVRLAMEVEYSNAGTVEYLYDVVGHGFYFLELNPRLQVEHPVTEMITGVNLPACQLQVAMGIPLHRIPDVRRLYRGSRMADIYPSSLGDPRVPDIDFMTERQRPPLGHVIATRVTAENPDKGFQPTSGSIQEINFRSTPQVWGYFSVDSSGSVHEFADSQIGHLFSFGPDRESARSNMVLALKELSIRGDIRTTIEYIAELMQSDDFRANRIDTAWLDARIAAGTGTASGPLDAASSRPSDVVVVVTAGLCRAHAMMASRRADYEGFVERGQLPPTSLLANDTAIDIIYNDVKYEMVAQYSGPASFTLLINNDYVEGDVRVLNDGGYLVLVAGRSHVAYLRDEVGGGQRLIVNGSTCLLPEEYDPSQLKASAAGRLTRWLVEDGAHVEKGRPFCEMEVMKMYMPLLAPEAGVVGHVLTAGATLTPGDLIGTLALDDPSCVRQARRFEEPLPPLSARGRTTTVSPESGKAHAEARAALDTLMRLMNGYYVPDDQLDRAMVALVEASQRPELPVQELQEALSVLHGRLPQPVMEEVQGRIAAWGARRDAALNANQAVPEADVPQLVAPVRVHLDALPPPDRSAAETQLGPVLAIGEEFANGLSGRRVALITKLVDAYFRAEDHFSDTYKGYEDIIAELRGKCDSAAAVFDIARAHNRLRCKNRLLRDLLRQVQDASGQQDEGPEPSDAAHTAVAPAQQPGLKRQMSLGSDVPLSAFLPVLQRLAGLEAKAYSTVALAARQQLISMRQPSMRRRAQNVERVLQQAVAAGPAGARAHALRDILDTSDPLLDVLMTFLPHPQCEMTYAAMESYVRRVYRAYDIDTMVFNYPKCQFEAQNAGRIWSEDDGLLAAMWLFQAAASAPSGGAMGMSRGDSQSDLLGLLTAHSISDSDVEDSDADAHDHLAANTSRAGVLAVFNSLADAQSDIKLKAVLRRLPVPTLAASAMPVNVVHIVVTSGVADTEATFPDVFTAFLRRMTPELTAAGVRRVTVSIRAQPSDGAAFSAQSSTYSNIFTFRQRSQFAEDVLVRHIDVPLAFHLELKRLLNFSVQCVPTANRTVHLYRATPKRSAAAAAGLRGADRERGRFFVRALVRENPEMKELKEGAGAGANKDHFPALERMFVESLNALELVASPDAAAAKDSGENHIFLNVLPVTSLSPNVIEGVLRRLGERYQERLARLDVAQVELRLITRMAPDAPGIALRLLAGNPTGFAMVVDTYVESQGATPSAPRSLTSIGETTGQLDGQDAERAYPLSRPFAAQRALARAMSDTVYCFDVLVLLRRALQMEWERFARDRPSTSLRTPDSPLEAVELTLRRRQDVGPSRMAPGGYSGVDDRNEWEVAPESRAAGKNDIGMVAWLVRLLTPECPDGREIVIIANDITFKAGSFGTMEDLLFLKASEFARERGLPRVYVAANSGARIGMAEELKGVYQVAWSDASDPSKGFRYLYLSPADYQALAAKGAVKAELVREGGEERYRITDIIGSERDMGVENLRGSGAIAGETSRAYDDIFTLTLCLGRSVGIGAYLVRLGQRTIQKRTSSPIILTGFNALNKLMGRPVYTSNEQLGGVKVMYNNGVSHLTVRDHLEGVLQALRWISFVPPRRHAPLPVTDITGVDVVERRVDFMPGDQPYDPRHMLAGTTGGDGEQTWLGGFFDKGSFMETLSGWAKTVVVGRARLGGIPCGVIITENRTVQTTTPADPASPESHEQLINQAGQVWFPDSAHKTAQAINDFRCEDLPLFIFANWRGFSGGQRDMFEEVLKYGAMIVDALARFTQPITVYIPPRSELRGGAWVVVDPTINSDAMEMYAALEGRGNVLEPPGAVSIKYKRKDLVAAAHRVDRVLQELDARQARDADGSARLTAQQRAELAEEVAVREEKLLPIFQQIAIQFADLHDTPGRMQARGAIKQAVDWPASRSFFYWRLRRRLAEFSLRQRVAEASAAGGDAEPSRIGIGQSNLSAASDLLRQWFTEEVVAGRVRNSGGSEATWDNDRCVLAWMSDHAREIATATARLRQTALSARLVKLAEGQPEAAVDAVLQLLAQVPAAKREPLMQKLRRGFFFNPAAGAGSEASNYSY